MTFASDQTRMPGTKSCALHPGATVGCSNRLQTVQRLVPDLVAMRMGCLRMIRQR